MVSLWTLTIFLALVSSSIEFVQSHPLEKSVASGTSVLRTEDLEQDGWRMVFRGTSGNGHSVYHAWIDGKNSNTYKPVFMKRSHGLHYRDNILDNWSNLGIKLVKFAFYDTDKEVAYVIFNGVDSNIHNWFDRKRVIDSSWADLTSKSVFNYFSIAGHFLNTLHDRRFYINRNYGGCPNDRGHLIVINSAVPAPICLFDSQPSYPTFIYSKYNSVDFFQRRMFGIADFMVVSIKTSG
ncbi:uncharacterized protein LOC132748194 [Ruditapes philippinarum]|uniref:uncharacterized protein LOC132748194 n=1 Tax=Ruditapes philippinarum TaxID=129788 RepID=UPI00295BD464|nr:uncharacterized protein LOC132748194 [Ruditapes philippinarum]